jgi:hypothetical protein
MADSATTRMVSEDLWYTKHPGQPVNEVMGVREPSFSIIGCNARKLPNTAVLTHAAQSLMPGLLTSTLSACPAELPGPGSGKKQCRIPGACDGPDGKPKKHPPGYCDVHKYKPGQYPDDCPPYLVRNTAPTSVITPSRIMQLRLLSCRSITAAARNHSYTVAGEKHPHAGCRCLVAWC